MPVSKDMCHSNIAGGVNILLSALGEITDADGK